MLSDIASSEDYLGMKPGYQYFQKAMVLGQFLGTYISSTSVLALL